MGEPPAQTFTLTNTGQATTGALAIALNAHERHAADVHHLTDACSGMTLAMNASCAVTVTLSPKNTGPQSASL